MWLPRAVYDHLVQQVESLQEQLTLERSENRRSERHWSNMFLRSRQSFPLAAESTSTVADAEPVVPYIDEGELEAMVEVGATIGKSREEVLALLKREKGIE